MDRRSWPWKKKSSDKAAAEKAAAASQSDQDNYKKPNYVQISVESYALLTSLEDQVKTYEEQVQTLEDQNKELNEKLSAANSEMTTKENLVKQHAKVAEEAVSGWEKAEAEALALKNHLESVTLAKLSAEDRASHLDGALKECMRQIRNLKEDHEQKLQEVVLTRTKQWDKIRLEFEAKIVNLEQELLKSAAENAALSRSLQERSSMLIKISEEKLQAEADVELLKSNADTCQREINSLKYELHIVSKELEIRNEEKNMSVRSEEVANKQHMEGVKKIAKLEAECQRLRGLVRKKLPGPAAMAQMKLEVENLGRDYGETRLRRSPGKASSPHLSPVPEFSIDNTQNFHKENEFLTERLLATEEETKMLKEALAKRNSELQASRSLCAKTACKLQVLEAQIQGCNEQKSSPKSIIQITAEGSSSQNASNPPSLTSMSEDGNDDERSCADSLSTSLISELSQFKKEIGKLNKVENENHLELMDDFLEMEKLACLSNDSNGAILNTSNNKIPETPNRDSSEVTTETDLQSEQHRNLNALENQVYSSMELSESNHGSHVDQLPLTRLHSKISMVFESVPKNPDMGKILEDIKLVLLEAHESLRQHAVTCASKEVDCSVGTSDQKSHPALGVLTAEKEISLSQPAIETVKIISQDLAAAISRIRDFIVFLGNEAMVVHDISPDGSGLSQKIEEFFVTFNKVMYSKTSLEDFVLSLEDFVLDLSHVLAKASELRFNFLGYKDTDAGISSPDCIDKVALPENKVVQKDSSVGRYHSGCDHISNPTSDLEVPDDGNLVSGYESNSTSCKFSLEEFEELKSEKDKLVVDLARCTENLEIMKSQLQETEHLLAEVKSQLASAQKSNGLAETQLKCMAESYRSLEAHAEELETELNFLRAKTGTLDNELQGEKKSLQDALARCGELQEQLQRNESCSVCAAAADIALKAKQETELEAAAEKLAECQETIFLLGKQLKALRPQTELMGSPYSERSQRDEGLTDNEPATSGMNLQDFDQTEMDTAAPPNVQKLGAEYPMDLYSSPCSPSDAEGNHHQSSPISSKHPKHRPTKSTSSSSPTPTPEKQSRGLTRFFSSKAKNGL
ncbi:filament-like plant protein 4 [Juglans microcarpa x Juglans regia]|uniref:filament-like plant protein 4 n=1 Tax=Juglans microcarpa x Juglans regia TaxID=2249226 RepID=UPI001B7F61E9|nr:filament-like plant protein 4 [Juglans microcarpa x Juglans regia]XP_041021355.1 filament-like plant protein 4 [Juglans microcarpa x Juglans regia]XP_041021356.1 filament-like plant protein 4 [Juglans microcarpa x Juglans regia]